MTTRISVVVCCHRLDRYDYLEDCFDSLLDQYHEPHEIVFVSDGSEDPAERVGTEYGSDHANFHVVSLDENRGLLPARNVGAKATSGDVVAFIDDDAEASPYWLAELARLYDEHDAIAAGGRLAPDYLREQPLWLPSEFNWLIGATHDGFAPEKEPTEVRNTFGSNISFKRGVFHELGGFSEGWLGRHGRKQMQAGETELCVRMAEEYGCGVLYSPEAIVYHKITGQRLGKAWAFKRAFWQGYSKNVMSDLTSDESLETENDYLGMLAKESLPKRLLHLLAIPLLTVTVAAGYLYAGGVGLAYAARNSVTSNTKESTTTHDKQ